MATAKKFHLLRNMRRYDIKEDIKHLDNNEMLKMNVTQLKEGLLEEKFTSVDLVNFYAHRCYTIGRGLSLTTQENFQTALKIAQERDYERQDAVKAGPDAIEKLGLLHGIPISVQDNIDQKSKMSMFGMAYLCDEFMKEDALILQQYVAAGAIPLVKGNTPQGLSCFYTENSIFGQALNPRDFLRSCGGISGGDSGLVTSKCIPLSIACDNNGSLNYSAAFCGTVSFKPTRGRFTSKGIGFPNKIRFNKFDHIKPIAGPIASCVDDCILGFKVQEDLEVSSKDPFQSPHVWNEELFKNVNEINNEKVIKIGMLQESPFLPVGSAVKRAMYQTEMTLRKQGYEVVPFFLTDEVWEQARDFMCAMEANGNAPNILHDAYFNYENLSGHLADVQNSLDNSYIKNFAQRVKNVIFRSRQTTNNKLLKKLDHNKFMKLLKQKQVFCNEISQKWRRQGLTAIISPIFPHCAVKINQATSLEQLREYSSIWNVLGFPCGALPVTKVKTQEEYFSDHFNDNWSQALDLSAQGSNQMPINLQVIGFSFEDEKVLGIMKTLEQSLNINLQVPSYLASCVRDSKEVEQMVERMSIKNKGSGAPSNSNRNSQTPGEGDPENHASRESTQLQ